MAFSDFTYPQVLDDLGLTEAAAPDLFAGVPPVVPSPFLADVLALGVSLGTGAHTEVSRPTWIVGPVLADLWGRYRAQLNVTAGATFAADPEAELTGLCDFLIGRGPHVPRIVAPVLVIFEAERDSIPDGLGQTIAGMVGVQRFNARRGAPVDPVYGCCTNGASWKFLSLSGAVVTQDATEYGIRDVDRILGVLAHIAGPSPAG